LNLAAIHTECTLIIALPGGAPDQIQTPRRTTTLVRPVIPLAKSYDTEIPELMTTAGVGCSHGRLAVIRDSLGTAVGRANSWSVKSPSYCAVVPPLSTLQYSSLLQITRPPPIAEARVWKLPIPGLLSLGIAPVVPISYSKN
jgi:hypothetical protein